MRHPLLSRGPPTWLADAGYVLNDQFPAAASKMWRHPPKLDHNVDQIIRLPNTIAPQSCVSLIVELAPILSPHAGYEHSYPKVYRVPS